jgi:acetylornithine deacetylase/succinyl-diaminopimelate desuccinylase-like protein
VLLDFRTAAESANSLQAFISHLAADWPHTLVDAWQPESSTLPDSDEIIYGYYTPPDHKVTQRVQQALSQGMGRQVEISSYRFATDGRLFVPYGIPVLGYGPGEEELDHTIHESISLDAMAEGLKGYAQLLRSF